MECQACGAALTEGAKFCSECGARTAPPATTSEQRKTVTVLFCDVTGSTAMGEQLDPESMRRVLARFFDTARRVIEGHGGTVEKFIGDAVMAIFGVPVLHEDDALRAVRAAADLQSALGVLNESLSRDHGISLQLRTGVNTGEVVTGTGERLATGDAVNVAARLEQLAAPGEVLLGEQVVRLVGGRIEAVAIGEKELKGKSQPVAVYRLVSVTAAGPEVLRRHDAPLVGRAHELRLLGDAFARVVREQSCGLVTLLGAAGVGKSRLAEEFLASTDATVVRGRCLSYGEGITYWPVVQVMKSLLASDRDAGALLTEDRSVGAGIAALFGEAERATSSTEIAWAVRKVLERGAARRPIVVVFDDLHWGEPTLFDLIEHVTDLSRSAPILLLCVARPELMDRRPAWGGGKLNATALLLEPLDPTEADALIDELVNPAELAPELRARLKAAAGGNPLFVEEMLRFAADTRRPDDPDLAIPPTIHALLAARLDQLDETERHALERGSVEGQSFHLGAVSALSPEDHEIPSRLLGLVRKDLIRPDRATLPGDDAFRFRHLLIRDAAYDRLAKSARADLHVRFAEWLSERAPELVEIDEIVGYHLEQAVKYRNELGPSDDTTRSLADVASQRLEAAGRRAFDRGDHAASLNLLRRSARLRGDGPVDVGFEMLVITSLAFTGEIGAAVSHGNVVADRCAADGDDVGELEARLAAASWNLNASSSDTRELEALIARARDVFEDAGDEAQAHLWSAVGEVAHAHCRFSAGFDAAERARHHAEAAGLRGLSRHARHMGAAEAFHGSMPVDEAIQWISDRQEESLFFEPWLTRMKAGLLALDGQFDEARAHVRQAEQADSELGGVTGAALGLMSSWAVERQAGDHAAASEAIRACCEKLEAIGEQAWQSTAACNLAESLYCLGRLDEAEAWARRGLELGADDDVATQAGGLQVLAKLAARRGEHGDALAMARRAVALMEATESVIHHGDALLDLAEVHALAGDEVAAQACVESAIEQFERKRAVVPVRDARRRLDDVAARAATSPPRS